MIVSHKHKFIFLKPRKTGGTSLEIGLSEHCGPDDVITGIMPEDEAIRSELGFPGPQNAGANKTESGRNIRNHAGAGLIRAGVGEDVWRSSSAARIWPMASQNWNAASASARSRWSGRKAPIEPTGGRTNRSLDPRSVC